MNTWPRSPPETLLDRRKRVFIVEDSPLIRERLVDAIDAMACCTVIGSADAEPQAIARIREALPDIVVADIQLREGSGLQVLRNIRERSTPRPTVVMLTNYSSREYYEQSLALGADAVFDKTKQFGAFLTFLESIH